MLRISDRLSIADEEIEMHAIRAQGAGGQNVNKLSTAVHLRFDVRASSLPEDCKARLLGGSDRRISSDGVVVIKAQRFRSQEKNREDALARLAELIRESTVVAKKRRPTRRTLASKKRRLESKSKRGQLKSLRGKVKE